MYQPSYCLRQALSPPCLSTSLSLSIPSSFIHLVVVLLQPATMRMGRRTREAAQVYFFWDTKKIYKMLQILQGIGIIMRKNTGKVAPHNILKSIGSLLPKHP
jgi:hypothetical protein